MEIEAVAEEGHYRVERHPTAVEVMTHGQRLVKLEDAHHRIYAAVVDGHGVGVVDDDSHSDVAGITGGDA